jgi:C1A family cysteine protease
MKNLFLISLCIIGVFYQAYSQTPSLPPLNPDFINYINEKNKDALQETTDDGRTLGLVPVPYLIDRTMPPMKIKKLDMTQAPSKYDLRNVNGNSYVSAVKNQGSCGSCWAFASIAAIESREKMLGLGEKDFSEQNVKNCHGFYWGHCSGGNDEIAISYFSRIAGPLAENDDPYNRLVSTCTTGYSPQSTFTHGWYLPNRYVSGYEDVLKYMIMTYGGFFTSYRHDNAYYNSTTKCYRYTGTASGNHAVLVVGWDDNKDMSSVGATNPGAWIIKNSWGSGWGENGFFYISYEDTKVHEAPAIWHKRIDYDNSAKLYYYDEIGAVSSTGFSSTTGYALVKYVANSNEKLSKIATWVRKAGTQVSIEVYDDFNGNTLSNRLCTLSTQTCDYAGYYTFDLSEEI